MFNQGFLCWMSKPRGTCRDTRNRKKAEILSQQGILCRNKKLKSNTRRILRHISLCCDTRKNKKHNICCGIKSPIATLIIATWKIMLRHYMKKLCHDKVMNVATLENKVSSPDKEIKSRQVMLTW